MMNKQDLTLPGFLFLIVSLVFVWSVIQPLDKFTWFLESLPVLIVIPLLMITYLGFRLTNLLYVLIAIHCIILLIGAHYTYAKVPLFDFLAHQWGFSRNHFDRLGHFMQGFGPSMVIRELLLRTSPLQPGKWLVAILIFSTLGISASYELFEWGVAELTGDQADAFLGTQGDVWDTQKDMFFALIGSILAIITLSRWHNILLKDLLPHKIAS